MISVIFLAKISNSLLNFARILSYIILIFELFRENKTVKDFSLGFRKL